MNAGAATIKAGEGSKFVDAALRLPGQIPSGAAEVDYRLTPGPTSRATSVAGFLDRRSGSISVVVAKSTVGGGKNSYVLPRAFSTARRTI